MVRRENVNYGIVLERLKELSDQEYQQKVWIEGVNDEVSGLDDTISALFDDSVLEKNLDKGILVYDEIIDDKLMELSKLIYKLKRNDPDYIVIKTREWEKICSLSREILNDIRELK